MVMYGADIGELRALATQFDRAADQLDGCRGALGGQVNSSPWAGADAVRFKGDWSSQYAPRLNATAGRLREAARSLRSNADDQERTSAVDGGPTASPGGHPGSSGGGGGGGGGGGWGDRPGVEPGSISEHDVFSWLQHGVLGSRPFDGEPVLEEFDLGFWLGKIPHVGAVVSAIGLGDVLTDPNESLLDKAWATGGTLVDAASGAVKHAGPVGYLTGVAAAQVWDVVDLAAHTDWSAETAQSTWQYIQTDPADALDGARDAIVGYLPDLVDNLWPF